MLVMFAVALARWPGLGPVMLLPLTTYMNDPSALNVPSCGSYAVGIRPRTEFALRPVTGITAMEFAPLLTAYSVLPSGDSVTANVAAPVYFGPWSRPAGARASILALIVFVVVSMTATWSALS